MSVASGCQTQVQLRGAQDVLLMSPREDTFFNIKYVRCSNFASGECENSCTTTPALGRRNIQTTISRAGDLLSQIYINARFNPFAVVATGATFDASHCAGWVNGLGYAMIEDLVCLIGNRDFDRMDGEFMFEREQVAHKPDRKLGRAVHFFEGSTGSGSFEAARESLHPIELNVPLQLWFCNYLAQSIPTIGLYWHDVQINLSLRSLSDLTYAVGSVSGGMSSGSLDSLQYVCNFQYLDRPERAIFANEKLEQVYVQHQTLGEEAWAAADNYKEINIRFNHPVTDIMFAPRLVSRTSGNDKEWFNFNGPSYGAYHLGSACVFAAETFRSAQMFFDNNQRTLDLSAEYLRQIPQHRSQDAISPDDFFRVYGYCFGARVNDILHTGSANFSRYDNASWRFTLWGSGTQTWAVAATGTDTVTNISLGNAATVKMHARNFQLNKTAIGMMGQKFAS
jgi:hypothetical protein